MSGRVVVIGAGVAGLAAATAIRRAAPDVELIVLEARACVGGLVESEHTPEGFVIEHGADCLLTSKPAGLAAVRAAGLTDDIVLGTGSRQSYVAHDDRLLPIPNVLAGLGPAVVPSLLGSPLLTARGKLRTLLEPLVPPRRAPDDESVRAFAVRRFGSELATALIEPLIGGIYGGATADLSADACLPHFRQLEREHGSVTLGTHRARRAAWRSGRGNATPLPPIVSLRRGMHSLPAALARNLDVRTGVAVDHLRRGVGGEFRIETARGTLACDGVVLAVPSWQAPYVVEALSSDLAAGLATIAHSALAAVTLAWRQRDVPHALDGTGWVRATGDRRATLACSWSSRKWPARAPAGFVLVRSVMALSDDRDDDLVAAAAADLRDLLGVAAPPLLTRVRRLPRATPLYAVGHAERVAELEARAGDLGAFALAGNAYGGMGVPDCVASGERAAQAVLAALAAGC
jgi:oxygen-dependent protoporphyrinogen oxidase